MPLNMDPVVFTINVVGDITKERVQGTFASKPILTHREELTVDRIKRDLLGPDSANASANSVAMASIIAELSVRLTDAPPFWKNSNGGLDLVDENVVAAVYEKVMKIEKDTVDGVKTEGVEAKQELKTLVGTNAPAIDLNRSSIG
jgi:hypothetical protein